MNSKKRSGSGIFLMEMIMVCGFFLLCAAVCIQVFLKSDSMSRLAREKNQAVLAAESLADAWKVYGREGLEPIFPHPSAVDGDGKSLSKACWDEDWERIGEDDGKPYHKYFQGWGSSPQPGADWAFVYPGSEAVHTKRGGKPWQKVR